MRPPPLYTQSLPLTLTFLLTPPPVHVIYNASTGPLGVVFVVLLLSPRRLQCRHAVHGPSGVVLAHRRRTTPARLPWELRSWSCYCVHVVYNASTRAWSLRSCAVVVRRFTHANLKSTSSGTIPPSPGSCWQRNVE